jgi:hypothetical protein
MAATESKKRKAAGEPEGSSKPPREKKEKKQHDVCDVPDLFIEYKEVRFGVKLETMKTFSKHPMFTDGANEKIKSGDVIPVSVDLCDVDSFVHFLYAWHRPYTFDR